MGMSRAAFVAPPPSVNPNSAGNAINCSCPHYVRKYPYKRMQRGSEMLPKSHIRHERLRSKTRSLSMLYVQPRSEKKLHTSAQPTNASLLHSQQLNPGVSPSLSTSIVDIGLLSPMMRHYVTTKRSVWDTLGCPPDRNLILMYRVGDFFESFFEDADTLSKVCDIALTSKDAGKALGVRVPMAGVPHYCLDEKIRLLLESNLTVAVVDQVQPAASVPTGKLVERAVTRLITPGTACDETFLDARVSSYLAAIVVKLPSYGKSQSAREMEGDRNKKFRFGFSYADVSTGEFRSTECNGLDSLQRILTCVSPTEVLLVAPPALEEMYVLLEREARSLGIRVISRGTGIAQDVAEGLLSEFHGIDSVESLGCRGKTLCTQAAAILLSFVRTTMAFEIKSRDAPSLNSLVTFSTSDTMLLDRSCLKNLEVLETVRDGSIERSLQWAVDRTATSMGSRCLRAWLTSPPMCLDTIMQRQNVVESFVKDNGRAVRTLQDLLGHVGDLERIGGRLILGRASPRELRSLSESIAQIPAAIEIVKTCLEEHMPGEMKKGSIQSLFSPVNSKVLALSQKVIDALLDPAPSSLPSELSILAGASKGGHGRTELRIFRPGYNGELDRMRQKLSSPESWITSIEGNERARTSIHTLRIRHVKNVGYVIRVPRSTGEKITREDPDFFVRLGYEQTQSTKAELRFHFEDLRVNEKQFHSDFAQILQLELRLYEQLRGEMASYVRHLRALGSQIAHMDVLAGLARVALEQNYVKPEVLPASQRVLNLTHVRHPVIEQTLPSDKSFVSNSFHLGNADDNNHPDMIVLCGPNAGGKSCALRSIGLVSILAQMGSFVPAHQAKLSLCDRIFTRVGAVDDLSRGQSTFQVEMAETACIMSHASSSSLILLDEIGRGTSAVDGISIAWSVSEFLAHRGPDGNLPPRSMFVTHYHELNHLSHLFKNIQSFHLHIEKNLSCTGNGKGGDDHSRVATYNIVPGPAYESYGITVAQRAGLPQKVIERAYEIARLLRAPSRMIGSQLRSGLTASPELCDDSAFQAGPPDKDEEQDALNPQDYNSGFEDGYCAALAEVQDNIDRLTSTLRRR